ncbi:putative NADH2 dehydrogenase subunit 14K [Rosellinia necatrix]|uniref:Putative NADH2 dehydrogenase subunit 14K n=1 Tax=Rosellinia necatrix TaxID=77044 RepID=A0A1W2TSB1_ROSNE|nr:putative NADH2 dehydrogenase subunit 14K [Rosellinia necatrix]
MHVQKNLHYTRPPKESLRSPPASPPQTTPDTADQRGATEGISPPARPEPKQPADRAHRDDKEYKKLPSSTMVHRVVFWTGFGLAVRVWQLGLEMRPFFNRGSLWAYPVFAGVGASFGYWLQGVDERQSAVLEERKRLILDKRARKAARDAEAAASS